MQFGYSSIRNQSASLNFSKGGATSLYVDQNSAGADDLNDGVSWDRPFMTIGGALASPRFSRAWLEVYVQSGTYPENVVIPWDNVKIFGVSQDGPAKVEISPITGTALDIGTGYCEIANLSLKSNDAYCAWVSGPGHRLHDLYLEHLGVAPGYGVFLDDADKTVVRDCYFQGNSALNNIGVLLAAGSVDSVVEDSYFVDWGDAGVAGYGVGVAGGQRCLFCRNIFNSGYNGIHFSPGLTNLFHTVWRNGFFANGSYDIYQPNLLAASGCMIRNNFFGYVGWANDSDRDGIADSVIDCFADYDMAPLSYLHDCDIDFHPRVIS